MPPGGLRIVIARLIASFFGALVENGHLEANFPFASPRRIIGSTLGIRIAFSP